MIADLNTYLTKAIPDTKLTIEKYADAKFEYLVCCAIDIYRSICLH
jgi:PRKCA-binding protein